MMYKIVATAIGIGLAAFLARVAFTNNVVTAEILDSEGDPHQVTISDTTSDVPFSFDVFLTTNFYAANAEFKVQTLGGAGVIEPVGRTFDQEAGWGYFSIEFTSPDNMTGSPGGVSSQTIGSLSQDNYGVPTGTTRIATIDAIVKAGTPPGSYRLNLVNVIASEYPVFEDIPGSPGQDYVVEIGSGSGPTLISAVSRKAHGEAGNFDIDLPIDPAESAGIECRVSGPTKVILLFSELVEAIDGAPDGTEVSLSAGTLESVSIEGNQMTINISDVPDASCLVIIIDGIAELEGNPLVGDNGVHIQVVLGDINEDGPVTIVDLGSIKAELFQPITSSNFRADVNVDGIINVMDMGKVKSSLFNRASCP